MPNSPASEPPADEATGSTDEADEQVDAAQRGVPTLLWTIGLSALVHLAFVIPVVLFAVSDKSVELDLEWYGDFETLAGIGHGMERGQWAAVEAVVEEAQAQAQAELEPEAAPEPEPGPEPEPAPEPEPEPEPEQGPESEVEAKPEEPTPVPRDVAVVREKKPKERATELIPARPPEPEERSNPLSRAERLPGLSQGGPSDLPDLRNYAPGNARMTALVRIDRVRETAYAEGLRRLLEAVPDYRILLESTGLDPVRELDTIFMASADPRYLHETFLAVRHSMDDATIKGFLGRRFVDPLGWQKYGEYDVRALVPESGRYQDPRQILLARPGLAIVTRPEWLEGLTGNVAPDSALAKDMQRADAPAPVFSLLDGLEQIERVAEREETFVLVSAQGLYFMLPGVGRLPKFEAVRLSVDTPDNPRLSIDLRFATEAEARNFFNACPAMTRQVIAAIPFARALGIATLVERLGCQHDGDYVTVKGQYTHREVANLMQLATPFIPRPPALMGLPAAPPPVLPPVAAPETAAEVPPDIDQPEADRPQTERPDAE
ncbi:MAG: hypothetical protein H0U74_01420 [Bradymonadaceae bacterium]|nr:hypothetical protein [Lujinxingiaceae bacterium]